MRHDRELRQVTRRQGTCASRHDPGSLRAPLVGRRPVRRRISLARRDSIAVHHPLHGARFWPDARMRPWQPVSKRLGQSRSRISLRRHVGDAAVCMVTASQLPPCAQRQLGQIPGPYATLSVDEYAALTTRRQRFYRFKCSVLAAPLAGFIYLIVTPRFTWLKGSVGLVIHTARQKLARPSVSMQAHAATYQTRYWKSAREYRHMLWNNLALLSCGR